MVELFSSIFAMTVAGSMIVGLMLLFRPVTQKIFPAKLQYGMGKMAITFFLLPVFLITDILSLILPAVEKNPNVSYIIQNTLPPNRILDVVSVLMERYLTFGMLEVTLLIWFMGVMVFAGWHFFCHRRLIKQLKANSFLVSEDTAAAILLSSCKSVLGVRGEVKLMMNHKITSPMLVGICRPMILLPAFNMSKIDLELVLTHELMHLKQKDLWVKMLALIARTLHWFNPIVHVVGKDINIWGELSCDELLASGMSLEERKFYGEAILNTLDKYARLSTTFCSSMCEDKRQIERRLIMMLNVKKMNKYIAVFAMFVLVAIAGIGTAVSVFASQDNFGLSLERNEFEKVAGEILAPAVDVAVFPIGSAEISQFVAMRSPGMAIDEEGIPETIAPLHINLQETRTLSKGGSRTYSFDVNGGLFSPDHNAVSVVITLESGERYQYISEDVTNGVTLANLTFYGNANRTLSNLVPDTVYEITIINLGTSSLKYTISLTSYIK